MKQHSTKTKSESKIKIKEEILKYLETNEMETKSFIIYGMQQKQFLEGSSEFCKNKRNFK